MTGTSALAAAMAKVQAELPKLERDRTVTVQTKNGEPYSYSYATLSNLSETILPLLAKHGLAFLAFPGSGADGKFRLCYSLLHESGEVMYGEFPLSGEGGIQQLGGRITYARRYCLAAVVGIAADEDDESRLLNDVPQTAQRAQRQAPAGQATAQRAAPARPAPPLPGEAAPAGGISAPQVKKLQTVFTKVGWTDRDDRLRAASVIVGRPLASSNDLTSDEAKTLIDTLDDIASKSDPATALTELIASKRGGEGAES